MSVIRQWITTGARVPVWAEASICRRTGALSCTTLSWDDTDANAVTQRWRTAELHWSVEKNNPWLHTKTVIAAICVCVLCTKGHTWHDLFLQPRNHPGDKGFGMQTSQRPETLHHSRTETQRHQLRKSSKGIIHIKMQTHLPHLSIVFLQDESGQMINRCLYICPSQQTCDEHQINTYSVLLILVLFNVIVDTI